MRMTNETQAGGEIKRKGSDAREEEKRGWMFCAGRPKRENITLEE